VLTKTTPPLKTPIALALGLAWGISPTLTLAEEIPYSNAQTSLQNTIEQTPPGVNELAVSQGETVPSAVPQEDVSNSAEVTLPTVTVSAPAYLSTETRVGKVMQNPQDIPQAVTSITNTIMEEQQVSSLREALRNVSGLTFNAAEGGRSGDNMMLRGFYTFGDMYLDGIRDTAQYNRETFNLEQVDVLRGSAAMLFGRGQAGGVINQVSKTPLLIDSNKVTVSGGSDDYREVTGDFNTALGDTTGLRVNVMKRTEGSWRSNPVTGTEPELDREGLALSFGTGLGTENEFLLSYINTRTDDIPDYGFSFDTNTRAPNTNFPTSYFWGIDRNFDESDTRITTAGYTHRFAEGEWRTQLRQAEYKRSYWARTPSATVAPGDTGLNLPSTNAGPTRAMDYETLTLQSDLSMQFNALGMEHEFLTGVEYLNEDSFRHSLENLGGTDAITPPSFQPYVVRTTGTPVTFDSDSYAIYLQDTVEFMPQWKATLGARRDQMDADYSSATSPNLKYDQWSYRSALSWQSEPSTHYYVGYSDSFSPTADLYQLTVAPMPAERSQVVELGLKKLYFNGDLAFRTALYRADKDWERNTDLESTAAILTKKRRTNGLEIEMTGRVTDNWEVFSGLALMDAKILEVAENVNATTGVITQANPGYAGQRARNTPEYTFNIWSTYKLDGGWKVGGGAEAKGDRLGFNPSGAGAIPTLPGDPAFHPNTAPAYVRWDAMASYEYQAFTVRMNVQNLFNKTYFDSLYDNGSFSVPGTERKVIVTGEYKF
jgi:catecholate siderophore receptor